MALISNITTLTRESEKDVRARFGVAQDGQPSEAQLILQRKVRDTLAAAAVEINGFVEDSREKALALTHLEEALMWTGKAIFR